MTWKKPGELSERQLQVLQIIGSKKYPIYKENVAEEVYGEGLGYKWIRLRGTFKSLKNRGFIEWGYDPRLDRNGWVISFLGREYLKNVKQVNNGTNASSKT